MSDQRERARLDVFGGLRADVLVAQPATITQLSDAGMQVETNFPLQLDSVHDFRLMLGDQALVIKGCVVHERISDVDRDTTIYRSGIEFVGASPEATAAIAEYVEQLRQHRRGTQ